MMGRQCWLQRCTHSEVSFMVPRSHWGRSSLASESPLFWVEIVLVFSSKCLELQGRWMCARLVFDFLDPVL